MSPYLKHSLFWLITSFLLAVFGISYAQPQLPVEGYFWTNQTVTESGVELCGEYPLNQVVCGEYGGKKIISVLINTGEEHAMAMRLKDHADYLGTPKQIWQAAKAGNAKAILVCKNAMYTVWQKIDGEGNPYNHRGTIQQWIDDGKPPRLDKFRPYTEWFQTSNVAEDDEI
uniref:Uncharacterized protein n=1 Tax=viral metagenome TaxID=1070528 RepID=A0A6M3KHV9_9ZZZZ